MSDGGEELRKARLMVWACLVFIAVAMSPAARVIVTDGSKVLLLFISGAVLSFVGALLALRRGMPLSWLAIWLTIAPMSAMTGAAVMLGGIHVPSAQALLLVPVYSFFLGGPRLGFVTLCIVAGVHVGLGIQAMDAPQGGAAARTASLIAIDGFLYTIVLGFHRIAKRAQDRLDRSNQELRHSNQRLKDARDATEAALRAKTRLLSMMSHEVRTPMSGIVGLVRLLQGTELDAEQRDFLQLLMGSSEALLATVNDVLDLAKMESGHVDLARVHFRPHTLLSDAARLMGGTVLKPDIVVRHRIDEELPEWLCGDSGRVRQILLNLLGNAIRFTETGHVEVRASLVAKTDEQLMVRFAVEDTGMGLSELQQARIFDAFAQVHPRVLASDGTGDGTGEGSASGSPMERSRRGTGLGLAICKQLVVLMGGQIGVDSEVGRGSTFWFDIAMPPGQDPSDELQRANVSRPLTAEREPSESGAGIVIHVLVVEDNPVNRRVAESMLRSLGCVVDVAATGQEAVAAVLQCEEPYDVVFMDRWLPDIDGAQATAEIRRSEPEHTRTTVIGLSASIGEDERNQCLGAGMDGYLSKPATRSQLASVLKRHTPWRRSERVGADGARGP